MKTGEKGEKMSGSSRVAGRLKTQLRAKWVTAHKEKVRVFFIYFLFPMSILLFFTSRSKL